MKKLLFATVFIAAMIAWPREAVGHDCNCCDNIIEVAPLRSDWIIGSTHVGLPPRDSTASQKAWQAPPTLKIDSTQGVGAGIRKPNPQHDRGCDTTRIWIDRSDSRWLFDVWLNKTPKPTVDSVSDPDKYWFIFTDPDCYPDTTYDTIMIAVSYYRQYVDSAGSHVTLSDKLYQDTSWVIVVDEYWRKKVHGMTHKQWDWFMKWLEGQMKPKNPWNGPWGFNPKEEIDMEEPIDTLVKDTVQRRLF